MLTTTPPYSPTGQDNCLHYHEFSTETDSGKVGVLTVEHFGYSVQAVQNQRDRLWMSDPNQFLLHLSDRLKPSSVDIKPSDKEDVETPLPVPRINGDSLIQSGSDRPQSIPFQRLATAIGGLASQMALKLLQSGRVGHDWTLKFNKTTSV